MANLVSFFSDEMCFVTGGSVPAVFRSDFDISSTIAYDLLNLYEDFRVG